MSKIGFVVGLLFAVASGFAVGIGVYFALVALGASTGVALVGDGIMAFLTSFFITIQVSRNFFQL